MQDNNLIFVSDAVLSFPHLAEPQAQTDKDTGKVRKAYNCDLIVEPTHPAIKQFMEVFGRLAQEKWKENAQAAVQLIAANKKQRCYGQGDEKVNSKTFQVFDGYAGKMYLACSKPADRGMPQIIGTDGKQIDADNMGACQNAARKMYGGCRVNAVIKPWLQQNEKGGIGVRCELIAIQFYKDGTPFGEGAVDASGMFGAVATAPAAPAAPGVTMPAAPFPAFMQQ